MRKSKMRVMKLRMKMVMKVKMRRVMKSHLCLYPSRMRSRTQRTQAKLLWSPRSKEDPGERSQ